MSLANTARSIPAMMRIGVANAVAYRAEMLVWVLATTMPLVMLALFAAVAHDAPLGRYGEADFIAYFLATFIARQLTGSWAAWEINQDVRQGTLSMHLLRPVHPLAHYAVENVAALPMRVVISIPVAIAALVWVGASKVTHDPVLWVLWLVAVVGGWLITLLLNLVIGCLAFFLESSLKVMDLYLVAYMVMSGYLIPVDLFPPAIRVVSDLLPFRYQIGLPVELMTGAYEGHVGLALTMVGRQWLFVALTFALTLLVWKRGVRRFAAYGG